MSLCSIISSKEEFSQNFEKFGFNFENPITISVGGTEIINEVKALIFGQCYNTVSISIYVPSGNVGRF